VVVVPIEGVVELMIVVVLPLTSIERVQSRSMKKVARERQRELTSSRLRAIKEYSSSTCCSNLVMIN